MATQIQSPQRKALQKLTQSKWYCTIPAMGILSNFMTHHLEFGASSRFCLNSDSAYQIDKLKVSNPNRQGVSALLLHPLSCLLRHLGQGLRSPGDRFAFAGARSGIDQRQICSLISCKTYSNTDPRIHRSEGYDRDDWARWGRAPT